MEEQKISPQQVIDEAQDILRSRRDDNLEDFARLAKWITDSTSQITAELAELRQQRRSKDVAKTQKDILLVRIAQHKDLMRRLKNAHAELSSRLSEFRDKTVGALNTARLRAAAKDPTRRNIWMPALTKNLRKYPSQIQKKALSAKMVHTKARWQPALEDMKAILDEFSVDLQREAAEKFLRKHEPNWAAKLSGDAEYRGELLDVFLESVKSLTQTDPN